MASGVLAALQPLDGGRRWGLDTEIVTQGVAFCMSDESSWYTGQQLVMDGGVGAQHLPQNIQALLTDLIRVRCKLRGRIFHLGIFMAKLLRAIKGCYTTRS